MIGVMDNSKYGTILCRRIGAGGLTARILTFLLLFLFKTNQSAGQEPAATFSAHFNDIPLTEALAILKETYHLKIAYDDQALAEIKVNQSFDGLSLQATLEHLLANTGLVYRILGRDKVLIRAEALAQPPAHSSEDAFFSGKVLDPITGEGLAFATITTLDGKRGTIADEAGEFSLLVSEADTRCRVQYLGYEGKDIEIKKGKEPLIVKLYAKPQEIPAVTIVDQLPVLGATRSNGSQLMHGSAFHRLPSFAGGVDIFRNLQLLPGVAAHDDLSAELKIRGGEGDENMIVLDGIQLYHVDHYFGIFSAINANIVDEVHLYKNNFPIEYGGRLSGLLEMKSPAILNKRANGQVGFDLLSSNASFHLPMAKDMALMLAGRMTNNNIANHKIFNLLQQEQQQSAVQNPVRPSSITRNTLIGIEPDFRFYDMNAKWAWKLKPKTQLTASFFQGMDQFAYQHKEEFSSRLGQIHLANKETNEETTNWSNRGFSFQIKQDWSQQLQSHINLNTSFYKESSDFETALTQSLLRTGEVLKERGHTMKTQNTIRSLGLNWKNTWTLSPKEQLNFGFHLIRNKVTFDLNVESGQLIGREDQAFQNALYGQYEWHIADPLKLSAGLRSTHYDQTGKWYLSPRLMTELKLDKKFKLKSSWNINHQFTREIFHEDRFGRTIDFWILAKEDGFPVATSEQIMMGGNFKMPGLEIDLEGYKKTTEGMMEYAQIKIGKDRLGRPVQRTDFRFFKGDRLTRGLDLLIKKTSGSYNGWLAYTLSKTTMSFHAIANGRPFPSADNRPHQLKLVNQYRWKNWDFSLNYIFSSGTPYTDISLLSELARDREEVHPEERISYLEDYHRVDVGINYHFPIWGGKARLGGSIFNLFDRKNVKQRQYIYSISESRLENAPPENTVIGTELQLLDFTPNLSFSFSF